MTAGASRAAWVAVSFVAVTQVVLGQGAVRARDLGDLTLEQLANVTVSSVSGRAEPLSRALGSVYVISADDIRRSGATTIMDALKLAPNLQVARTGAETYAITARGFNSTLANKLLVLIDGRSIYTPTFSGVFWDAQDVLLEDVERIEVISGPGGVLWGANAVNGVINISTKSSDQTRGGLSSLEAGTSERHVESRFGDEGGTYRFYAQASRLDDTRLPDGTDNNDGRDRAQAGFRSDWTAGSNGVTVQGDLYASENNLEPQPSTLHGADLLARYSRHLGDGAGLRVQAYYDHTSRSFQKLDTVDLELTHVLPAHRANTLLWGAGARYVKDRIDNPPEFAFQPPDKSLFNWNVYLQDVIAIGNDMEATLGARLDRNTYTGIEVLPSVRFGWHPTPGDLLWFAASRAVREPSRIDTELFLPGVPFVLAGGPGFESEISYVYELGYRGQPLDRFSWAGTIFYHQLYDQRSVTPGPTAALVENDLEGHEDGVELWGMYRASQRFRVWFGYTYLERTLSPRPGTIDLQPASSIGSDPKQWAKLRAAFDLGRSLELDLMARFYDRLENISVPSYVAVDARLGFSLTNRIELSLVIQNMLDDDHIEWSPGAELTRSSLVRAVFKY